MPLKEIQKSICKCFKVHPEFKEKIKRTSNTTEILKLLEGAGNTVLNTQSLDALIEAFTDYYDGKINELSVELDDLVEKKEAFNSKVFRFSQSLSLKLLSNTNIDMSRVRSVKCIANESKAVIEGILTDISVLVIESFRWNHGIRATVDVPGLFKKHTIVIFSTGLGDIAIVLVPHIILNAVADSPSLEAGHKV